jgi:hypothetical protein
MYSKPPAGTQEIKRETVDLWPDMARILGVSRNAIYEAARRGDFRTIRVGKRILVPLPEVRRLVDGESIESIHPTAKSTSAPIRRRTALRRSPSNDRSRSAAILTA